MKKHYFIPLALMLTACGTNPGTSSSEISSMTSQSQISTVSSSSEEPPVIKPYIDGKKLVVFGDSITAMGSWGSSSASELNTYFYNAAIGGITTAQGIERFPSFVPKQHPDFVTILFGMNDLIMVSKNTPRVSLEQFYNNLVTLVNMVKEINATPILLTTNPLNPTLFWNAQGQKKEDYEVTNGDPLAWLDKYNDVTRQVAKDKDVWLVDMRSVFSPTRYATYLSDGIHLNSKGNELFTKTLVNSFMEKFDHDPNAEKVVDPDRSITVTPDMGNVSLMPTNADDWYFVNKDNIKVEVNDGVTSVYNTNGLWPEALADLFQPVNIDVIKGKLNFNIKTNNVNASIILFLNGKTPATYSSPDEYIVINSYLGCNIESGSGDIKANQTIEGSIDISTLPISKSIIRDGMVKISGVKIFAAGTRYEKVVVNDLSVCIPKK